MTCPSEVWIVTVGERHYSNETVAVFGRKPDRADILGLARHWAWAQGIDPSDQWRVDADGNWGCGARWFTIQIMEVES